MGKRNKKQYYKSNSKKGRYVKDLQPGMCGFLITCGNKAEKDVTREAYSILNEYADRLYGQEKLNETDGSDNSDDDEGSSEEDIEKALQKEVKGIKEKKNVPRRFQAVDPGAKNCVFIKTTLEKPAELLSHIITDIHTTKQSKSRYIMKMFPVLGSCYCDNDKIKKTSQDCLQSYFEDIEEFSYCCQFKKRNNNKVSRDEILPLVCNMFNELKPKSTVEYNNPDYVISIDIFKSVCCFSVLKDFAKYRKYNLQEIVSVEAQENKTGNAVKDGLNEKVVKNETESKDATNETESKNGTRKTGSKYETNETESKSETNVPESKNETSETESKNDTNETESKSETIETACKNETNESETK